MANSPSTTINTHAQSGFAKSAAYDQHRPTYPAASVQELLEQCRVAGKQGAKIVDLAAGTGKFTELLAGREEAFEIIAVEPHDGMREVLEGKKLPRTTVVKGKGDEMGSVGEESVDAVIVAQVGACLSHCDSLFTMVPSSLAIIPTFILCRSRQYLTDSNRRPSTGSPTSPPSKKSTASSTLTAYWA